MKRTYELVGLIEDAAPLVLALRRFLDRRVVPSEADVVGEAGTPAELDSFRPGNTYGRFGERIIRREVRRAGVPAWFDPREFPGQFGIIGESGLRCYIEVEVDCARRNEPSTFDLKIMSLVESIPEQTSLL